MRQGVLIAGLILIAIFFYREKSREHAAQRAESAEIIDRLERENGRLKARISRLESEAKPQAPVVPTPPPLPTNSAQPPAQSPTAERIVDVPPPGSPVCLFATINSTTQLSHNLTWDTIRGGTYVGELPAGSIVEILYGSLYIWKDYPDEHALYVKVVESPSPSIVGQVGYIELRRINFKRCNLGAEFEK